MKIRVSLVVDVDPAKWVDSTGRLDDGTGKFVAAEVREDVRSYYLTHAQNAALTDETDAAVTLA
jgi:hypothetical protein